MVKEDDIVPSFYHFFLGFGERMKSKQKKVTFPGVDILLDKAQ